MHIQISILNFDIYLCDAVPSTFTVKWIQIIGHKRSNEMSYVLFLLSLETFSQIYISKFISSLNYNHILYTNSFQNKFFGSPSSLNPRLPLPLPTQHFKGTFLTHT